MAKRTTDLLTGFPSTFCGYLIKHLKFSWVVIFNNGNSRKANARPCDLAEAVMACKYYDELPPSVKWDKAIGCYVITRRKAWIARG